MNYFAWFPSFARNVINGLIQLWNYVNTPLDIPGLDSMTPLAFVGVGLVGLISALIVIHIIKLFV